MKINKNQRGLLFKGGEYVKLLMPGSHFVFPGYKVELYSVTEQFKPSYPLDLLLEDISLRNELHILNIKDNELLVRFDDGKFAGLLGAGKHSFWKSTLKQDFLICDLSRPEIDKALEKQIVLRPEFAPYLQIFIVEAHEKGLLFIDRKFVEQVNSGTYYYWKGISPVNIVKVDTRQHQIDIAGQEMMTRDKVTLRLNFVCQYKIDEPVKAYIEIKDYTTQLYVSLQLILREYVGTQTLDEILSKKEEIGNFITERIKEKAASMGLQMISSGVKDVILPGEIKEILNQVLIAEKKAQANIIMRREETASTRSLLNTVKLMEENEMLYKLKEMEYIERISEKIGQLSVTGNVQLVEQLKEIFVPEKKEKK